MQPTKAAKAPGSGSITDPYSSQTGGGTNPMAIGIRTVCMSITAILENGTMSSAMRGNPLSAKGASREPLYKRVVMDMDDDRRRNGLLLIRVIPDYH